MASFGAIKSRDKEILLKKTISTEKAIMEPAIEQAEFKSFLSQWNDNEQQIKKVFLHLKDHLARKPDSIFEVVSRPGVSYSLRTRHQHQKQRPLFAMIDIIDDDPIQRWLSVCFFGAMISDPDGIGDFVPEGLLGEDAHCFDIEAWDDALVAYVIARLDEAYDKAASEPAA